MRERPILFTGPMVRAILAGNKTQTRRVVKLPHTNPLGQWEPTTVGGPGVRFSDGTPAPEQPAIWHTRTGDALLCPYGQPGDRLWVRESTHQRPMLNPLTGEPLTAKYDGGAYTADGADVLTPEGFDLAWWYSRKSCPSIHMPRFACRLVLEITGVRAERLQDISEADAQGEGCAPAWLDADDNQTVHAQRQPTYRQGFARLWREINGPESWNGNPWVWVVAFRQAATDTKEM